METIDGPVAPGPQAAPQVALRLVTTYDDTTRRFDVALRGSQGVLVEDGTATPFPVERLWPVLRDLLPPLEHLRADPTGRRTRPGPTADAGLAARTRAAVVLATVVGDDDRTESVSLRTWLATDDELWSVTPRPEGNEVLRAEPGALADLLVWDVTAAMEALVRVLEAAS